MKLLDVLAKEMKGWPEGGYSVGQAADGTLHVNGKRGILLYHTKKAYSQPSAGKFYDDVVTKDMWENSLLPVGCGMREHVKNTILWPLTYNKYKW